MDEAVAAMEDVQLIIPYRGAPGRSRPFGFVTDWYALPYLHATGPNGPFNRAAAINHAVAQSTADILVISDADIVVPIHQVATAITLAKETGRPVIPYSMLLLLSRTATDLFMQGEEFQRGFEIGEWPGYSPVVLTRECWDLVGGFDTDYVGWGEEDVDFYRSCYEAAGGTLRTSGSAFHLWHPPHTTPEKLQEKNRARLQSKWGF